MDFIEQILASSYKYIDYENLQVTPVSFFFRNQMCDLWCNEVMVKINVVTAIC